MGEDHQLIMSFPALERYEREDFLQSACNQAALNLICSWPEWFNFCQIIIGAAGAGKTHLAHIWRGNSHAEIINDPRSFARLTEMLSEGKLIEGACLVLEDCDQQYFIEADLFHLFNHLRNHAGSLLLTARTAPQYWQIKTPDLLSRLRLAPLTIIEPPDDHLLRALLIKLFSDRQIQIEINLIDYLLPRIERSFDYCRGLVAALDAFSLARGRKVTRQLAAEFLAKNAAG